MTAKKALLLAAKELEQMALKLEYESSFDCKIELQPLFYQSGKVVYTPNIIFGSGKDWKCFYVLASGEWLSAQYQEYNSTTLSWYNINFKYFESKLEATQAVIDLLKKSSTASIFLNS